MAQCPGLENDLTLKSLLFQARPGKKVRGHLQLESFSEETRLCPVDAVRSYLARVEDLRVSYSQKLLVSFLRIETIFLGG